MFYILRTIIQGLFKICQGFFRICIRFVVFCFGGRNSISAASCPRSNQMAWYSQCCATYCKQRCTTYCKQRCTTNCKQFCTTYCKQCCTSFCKQNCTCCYNKDEEERHIFSKGHLQALEGVLFIDPVPSNASKKLFLELKDQMLLNHQIELRNARVIDLKESYAIVISDNQSRTLADVNNAMTNFERSQYKQLILIVTYMDYDKNLANNKYDLETQYPGLEFVFMNYRQVHDMKISLDEDAVKATAEAVRKRKRQRIAI